MFSLQSFVLTLALAGGGDTVLLDFYSDSCGPCHQMSPLVDRLGAAGYPVRKVNIERERELAGRFGITRIPCFVMVVDGKEVDRMVGATTLDRLQAMCQLGLAKRATVHPPVSPRPQTAIPTAAVGSPAPVVPLPVVQAASGFSAAPAQTDALAGASMPGWRITPVSATQPAESLARSDEQLIAATVRLRIEDATGHSFGTGTIIDSREGEALILTCGHLFRDSKGEGSIEVDLFGPRPARKVPGRLLAYDADHRDVALVSIRPPCPVTAARVAPPGYEIHKGATVASVGCNNGEDPTVRHSRVTSLDKFVGPPNLQVAGLPVQGRSGGGLFSREGYVIGVCNAADPTDNEGLFAALASVHSQLDEVKLSYIYQSPGDSSRATVATAPPAMPKEMPAPDKLVQLTNTPSRPAEGVSVPAPPLTEAASAGLALSPEERAALEEIRRRKAQGFEVVCVIRSLADPQAKSEIIVLNKASQAFLKELAVEGRAHQQQQLTSLSVPTQPHPQPPLATASGTQASPVAAKSNWQPNWGGTGRGQ
ncbi:MAG: hypothetical protein GXY83_30985 [Rhodopirellula sp.]|nr:hypothetical protein [Rhodopirellula sp.]